MTIYTWTQAVIDLVNVSAETLRQWRALLQITQEEAAKLFGVARATYINWETGGPIPISAQSVCADALKRWKQRDRYGFVTLIYTDKPIRQSTSGVSSVPMMQQEPHPTNYDAIYRACYLFDTRAASSAFIVDQEDDIVWNMKELPELCRRWSSMPRRIAVITTGEAKQLRRKNSILEVEVSRKPEKPGWKDIQYILASQTGGEDDNFEVRPPLIQPGAVKDEFVEEVIQEAARKMKAAYIVLEHKR
jgi:hypothetical protein